MPTYNRACYLGEAIRSVLAQSFGDLELIVVDDGSTDETDDLMRQIQDPRVRYTRQGHHGISAAMNAGLRAARGAYVARLDSDDVWLPMLLEVETAQLDARPEIAAVYAKAQAMDHKGDLLAHTQGIAERYPGKPFRSILYDDFTCNSTVLARRKCFDRAGGYDESLVANEDWDMWLRVARYDRFAFVDRVMAHIRWHDGNLTGLRSSSLRSVLESRSAVLDKAFARADLTPAEQAMKPIAYRNVYTFAGLRWLDAGKRPEARAAFRQALRAGGDPGLTCLRILWAILRAKILSRFSWGRRSMQLLADLRRRRAATVRHR